MDSDWTFSSNWAKIIFKMSSNCPKLPSNHPVIWKPWLFLNTLELCTHYLKKLPDFFGGIQIIQTFIIFLNQGCILEWLSITNLIDSQWNLQSKQKYCFSDGTIQNPGRYSLNSTRLCKNSRLNKLSKPLNKSN